jgi:hypothetical protein
VQQTGALEVKADAQLGACQRGLAEPAARACGVARKSGDSRLEKRTTLLTNTAVATISEGEDLSAICVSNAIAAAAGVGLDQIDSGIGRVELNGIDLQIKTEPGSYQ